jgi:hypothetical protein
MNLPNFFAELKHRNIYKVAIARAVIAWLLMQVFPFLKIPNWAIRLVIMVLALGAFRRLRLREAVLLDKSVSRCEVCNIEVERPSSAAAQSDGQHVVRFASMLSKSLRLQFPVFVWLPALVRDVRILCLNSDE